MTPERGIVESPDLGRRFVIGDNTPKIGAYCPIDGTQLVSVIEMDFSNYSCEGCGASYKWGDTDSQSLAEQARGYASQLKQNLTQEKAKLARIEEIVQLAEKKGLL